MSKDPDNTQITEDSKATDTSKAGQKAKAEIFTFGEPTPVLSGIDFIDLMQVQASGDRYTPAIQPTYLAKLYNGNQHHTSAVQFKRNVLVSCMQPHPLISHFDALQLVQDYLVLGNAYVQVIKNKLGGVIKLRPVLGVHMRRLRQENRYVLQAQPHDVVFEVGEIIHIRTPDLTQEIYGMPEYLAALQSALLNEAATLFRRKYYENGSHAGFIMYLTDPQMSQEDVTKTRKALEDAKGPGNFKNMFMYSPGGDKDGLKIMPISEVTAKDEFLNIKDITMNDILAMHRIPPQLLGLIPKNTGGFGSPSDAAEVWARNELQPLQMVFSAVNDAVGEAVFTFKPYVIGTQNTQSSP